jgi:predicted nucleic acid-binding Zn finger protein
MKPSFETELLKKICKKAESEGKVTEVYLSQLSTAFGLRFKKAWESLKERRVKKYIFKPSGRVVWIVVGKERDYLLMTIADFCSCDDFYFRVMNREVHLCYHLIAQKLAKALKWYDLIEEEDELYDTLMKEWKIVMY